MSLHKRFWRKVRIGQSGKCWEWVAAKDKDGYGTIQTNNGKQRANRVVWELSYGEIDAGMCVLHHCDNPSCVNPSHLFLGTLGDNNRDRAKKGRSNSVSGSEHYNAKLDETDVMFIRYWLKSGYTHQKIADVFGVSRVTITDINGSRTWKCVEDK